MEPSPAPHGQNSVLVERLLTSDLMQAEWVLYFLLVLLAVCVVVVAWKVAFFVQNGIQAKQLRQRVSALVGGGEIEDFCQEVEEQGGVEAAVLRHALRYIANGPDVVDRQMVIALTAGRARMESGLTFLGTVGANAPFVGLFGTVLGIIKAFRDLSFETQSGASAVMAGISEALVATAVGLLVAIPAVVAFNYLQRQVKKTVANSGALNQQVLFRLRAGEESG